MQQPVEDDKTYLFYVDGGYDFDQKSGTSVAGGRYFWNPEHPHVGSGEETRIISSRADGVLLDQYVVYPFSVADASRLKCVVATCLHLLMNHAATSFCFVTDQADAIRDTLAAVRPGRGKRDGSPARPPGWKAAGGDIATISYEAGEWYISFPVAEHHPPAPRSKPRISVIGVDANTHAYVCSDGTAYAIPEQLARAEESVRLAQQTFDRREPGSNRHRRALDILAKRKAHQARLREDWLDKITYDLATRAEVVVIEDLAVQNMTATAKGHAGDPGTNVAAKAGLNRSMLNASFGAFREKLTYKCKWHGSRLEVVAPHHTSTTCSSCGTRKPMPLSQRTYSCETCGLIIDRDLNAAKNIRNKFLRGDAQVAPGATGEADGTGVERSSPTIDQASRPVMAEGRDTHAGIAGFARKGTVTPSRRLNAQRELRFS